MKQNVVRLTEEDLNKVIKESVEKILKENMTNEGFWGSLGKFGGNAGKKFGNSVANKYGQMKQGVQDKYGQMKQNVKPDWQNARQEDAINTMRQLNAKLQQAFEVYKANKGTAETIEQAIAQQQPQQQAQVQQPNA